MNYYCEEWERMQIKGKIKFILDFKNLMIIIMFIFLFLIVKSITFRQFYLLKEISFYIIYMVISISILLIISQCIKWNLYMRFFKGNFKKESAIMKLKEIFVGLLNLWIPLGIFCSIFIITPNSHILKNLNFTLKYISYFTGYVIMNCMAWLFIGFILEIFININFLKLVKNKNQIYVFISKRVD
ncbi:hypothetical protein ACJDU8_12500 [Clostridium sp. WILCCON 0269]|uniref:DUF4328 domain-containing protein n=1 Tax=Candidatus Clostridium eludens TaxID=3381663 RepID=A0ABW8SK35_9CLOT